MTDAYDERLGGFEMFVARSSNPRAAKDENWRLGFSSIHRDFPVTDLAKNLADNLLKNVVPSKGSLVLDIGAGGGALSVELDSVFSRHKIPYFMVDAPEVLMHSEIRKKTAVTGRFPDNLTLIKNFLQEKNAVATYIIANSLLHYAKKDDVLFEFLQGICDILGTPGAALIGDVPILEMKVAQAKANSSSTYNSENTLNFDEISKFSRIAMGFGCSVYLLPQPRDFPMHPHRLDVLILKHEQTQSW